jgi:hypothetical protein
MGWGGWQTFEPEGWTLIRKSPGLTFLYSFNKQIRDLYMLAIVVGAEGTQQGSKQSLFSWKLHSSSGRQKKYK